MRKMWEVFLSGLFIILLANAASADLSDGIYSLDTGKWQLNYGPNTPASYIGSTGDMESDTGLWSCFNSYFNSEPEFLGYHEGDTSRPNFRFQYQNSIMSFTLSGKKYSNIVVDGEFLFTIVLSGAVPVRMENVIATGVAYVKENGIQYQLDISFTSVETERVNYDYAKGDVTNMQVVVSTIPVGIEEGHWDSVSSTPLIELGPWTTDVRGHYPSWVGSYTNSQSTGGQWEVQGLIYGPSAPSAPGHVEVPIGGNTYIYETYTTPVYNGSWIFNYNGKEYNTPFDYSAGTLEWTGIWLNRLSNTTFLGLTGIVGTYYAIIEEYGVKYECKQVVHYNHTGSTLDPVTGYWQHMGDTTRIDLDVKAITPQTIEISDPVLVDPAGTDTYDAGLEMESGDLAGAKIIFNTTTETVDPTFGVPSNVPDLDSTIDKAVGEKLNLLPHGAAFTTPVRIFIPCPGADDVSKLSVYNWSEENGWVQACTADGTVLLTDWMVAGSRVNHNETDPKTIEIKINHFSAAQATIPRPAELAVDFDASGLYAYNGVNWRRLSSWNPDGMAGYDNEVAVDFGSNGLYTCNGTRWQRLSLWNPEKMKEWMNGLAVDFGVNGLYTRNENSWSRISSWDAVEMLDWEKGLMVNFGINGLYTFDGLEWKKASNWNSEGMYRFTVPSNFIMIDFGTNGFYVLDDQMKWTKVSSWNPEGMADHHYSKLNDYGYYDPYFELAVDFGDNGLYLFNGTWRKVSNWNPESLTSWGGVLVVDFGTNGLWGTSDGNVWSLLSSNDAAIIKAFKSGVAVDYGPGGMGFFTYDGSSWTKISSLVSSGSEDINFE